MIKTEACQIPFWVILLFGIKYVRGNVTVSFLASEVLENLFRKWYSSAKLWQDPLRIGWDFDSWVMTGEG